MLDRNIYEVEYIASNKHVEEIMARNMGKPWITTKDKRRLGEGGKDNN